MNPKVSIVVPVYGAEKYLDRCVNSLVGQSLHEIEIVLVDDESPDRCPFMCDEWAKKDTRIHVIHQRNTGAGLARNAALPIIKGEYVTFVDSDDYVASEAYEICYNEAIANHADAIFTDGYVETQKGTWVAHNSFTKTEILNERETRLFALDMIATAPGVKEDRRSPMSTCRTLYKTAIVQENHIRFFSERIYVSEDMLFNIDFFMKANSVVLSPFHYYYYCLNGASYSHSFKPQRYDAFKKQREILIEKTKHMDGYLDRVNRCMIYYTRYHIMELLNSDCPSKKKHLSYIMNDDIWDVISQQYPPSYLASINRWFYYMLLCKSYWGVYFVCQLVTLAKYILNKR